MTTTAAPARAKSTPIAKLHGWDRNPRRITESRLEQLKRSLEAEPDMLGARPLIALPDGTVIAGNQRLAAAQALGWTHLPVVTVDLDPARAAEWALRDNQSYGDEDVALTGELIRWLASEGRDPDLTGYDSQAIDRILSETRTPGPVDPDDAPPVPAKPRSKPGEVYELGAHRLVCGDVRDPAAWDALLEGHTADLCVTDPPYGVDYQGGAQAFSAKNGKRRVRTLEGDKNAELYTVTLPVLAERLRPDGALYLWFSDSRSASVLADLKDAGFRQRAVIIWAKDVPTGSLIAHYIPRHEPLVYASTGDRAPRWFGPTNEVTVWEHPKPRTNELHPTQKPVALYERAIANSSERGDLVLDPFAGSGTALIACDQTGRRARLMELDPGYCDVIRDRYEALTDGRAEAD